MKTSFLMTAASVICLLLPQARADVLNMKEVGHEIQITLKNESLRIVADEDNTERLIEAYGQLGVDTAIAQNERELQAMPGAYSSCVMDKEIETAKCDIQSRHNAFFDIKANYLVCTVTSVFKCAGEKPSSRLNFEF